MSKDYQTIKTQIQEAVSTDLSSGVGYDPYRMNAVDDVGHDFFYISRSDEFRRLNAYVSQILHHEVLDPDEVIKNLSVRLSAVGINIAPFSFKDEGMDIDGVELEAEQYGGYAQGEDGGIVPYALSDKIPGGLYLVLSWTINNGKYVFNEAYFASGAELDAMEVDEESEDEVVDVTEEAKNIKNPALKIDCPKCGSPAGESCKDSGPYKKVHSERITAYHGGKSSGKS